MLHLIPPPVHRMALRAAHGLRKRWWRLSKRQITGVRVLALDDDGRVLLIRHAYGSGKWMPPGGGLARGESATDAAVRELAEETGCVLLLPVEIDMIDETLHSAPHRVHLVAGRTHGTPLPDGREVIEARFFAPHALPDAMVRGFAERLPGWIRTATSALAVPLAPLPRPQPAPAPPPAPKA